MQHLAFTLGVDSMLILLYTIFSGLQSSNSIFHTSAKLSEKTVSGPENLVQLAQKCENGLTWTLKWLKYLKNDCIMEMQYVFAFITLLIVDR